MAIGLLINIYVHPYCLQPHSVYAIGFNKQAAYMAGVSVKAISISTLILVGMFAAITSICLFGY